MHKPMANAAGLTQGHTDNPLNAEGMREADALAAYLWETHNDIRAIHSSDLTRAQQTAKQTATLFEQEIIFSRKLRERHYGSAEMLPRKERSQKFPDDACIPGAETYEEVLARFQTRLLTIAQNAQAQGQEKIAIFTHARAMTLLLAEIPGPEDRPKDPQAFRNALPTAAIVHIFYNPEHHRLRFSHIETPPLE